MQRPGGRPGLPLRWSRAGRSPHGGPAKRPESAPHDGGRASLARLEAVLWLAGEPLTLRRLAKAAGLEGVAAARVEIAELRRRLAARRSALEVVEVAGGFCLMTHPALAPWIERFADRSDAAGPNKIGRPQAETLAIVAHRQPVVKTEIEAIRGVGCADVLRQLLEVDLLRIVGRSEELGKPFLYGTTERFLKVYGLGSLDDLPGCDEGAEGAGPSKDNAASVARPSGDGDRPSTDPPSRKPSP